MQLKTYINSVLNINPKHYHVYLQYIPKWFNAVFKLRNKGVCFLSETYCYTFEDTKTRKIIPFSGQVGV